MDCSYSQLNYIKKKSANIDYLIIVCKCNAAMCAQNYLTGKQTFDKQMPSSTRRCPGPSDTAPVSAKHSHSRWPIGQAAAHPRRPGRCWTERHHSTGCRLCLTLAPRFCLVLLNSTIDKWLTRYLEQYLLYKSTEIVQSGNLSQIMQRSGLGRK